jgi:hypothetical protein
VLSFAPDGHNGGGREQKHGCEILKRRAEDCAATILIDDLV